MMGLLYKLSNTLLLLMISLLSFYLFMDINLYWRIQNYPIKKNYYLNSARMFSNESIYSNKMYRTVRIVVNDAKQHPVFHNNLSTNYFNYTFTNTKLKNVNELYEELTWISCSINPLCYITVKAIFLDHTNHYLYAPAAEVLNFVLKLSRSSVISANMISYFHVVIACLAGKLISLDNLCYRRVGVFMFQFRTILDDLDGQVARAKNNVKGERSEIGSSGFYVDGICDGLGCIALLTGVFFFLKKPSRRGYYQLPILDSKTPESTVLQKLSLRTKEVVKKILSFTGQLLLSSTAWNRYIAVYQDLLEKSDVTSKEIYRQNLIYKSNGFLFVAWLWRIVNVHSLLHWLSFSIFCDKLWSFVITIQYFGYLFLLVAICATEMHILEAQNFIFGTITKV